jgi:hypothetical protein
MRATTGKLSSSEAVHEAVRSHLARSFASGPDACRALMSARVRVELHCRFEAVSYAGQVYERDQCRLSKSWLTTLSKNNELSIFSDTILMYVSKMVSITFTILDISARANW